MILVVGRGGSILEGIWGILGTLGILVDSGGNLGILEGVLGDSVAFCGFWGILGILGDSGGFWCILGILLDYCGF